VRLPSGDRLILGAAAAAVTAVAGFAAVVSYSHIYDLARAHGQAGTAARLLPLSVDGLIVAASLVMLHEARGQRQAPALARAMLGLGVAATVAANVAYGARYGLVGAVISAWPAIAFIGYAEMIMGLVRRGRVPGVPGPAPAQAANGHLYPEATEHFAADLAAGTVPAIRRIRDEMHVGQPKAERIRAHLDALARTR
jgi:Protein of unknown function (DUF2637)